MKREKIDLAPDTIYLQNPYDWNDDSINYMEHVTWCDERVHNTDIEYKRVKRKKK